MRQPQTNLKVLRRSNRKPRQGDLFVMQPDHAFLFGRVIRAQPTPAPMPLSYLIYVYADRSLRKEPSSVTLRPDRLLLPPVFINRMPWTKGYFETVGHEFLDEVAVLPQHCFWDAARARYVDLQQNRLPGEIQPCGDWALASYRWLDDG
ncbi:Imm26 family immunity protein [Terrabacter sp. GCM10028922]|uniref:Imm26 family immunity protein n=1 Tax=Terrabacter sp. GCM10028922 TaxID=3273428 RepID=UPI0036142275